MLGTDSGSPWSLQTLYFFLQSWPKKVSQTIVLFFFFFFFWEGSVSRKCTVQKLGPTLSTLAFTQGSQNFLSRGRYLFWHLELEEGLVKEED